MGHGQIFFRRRRRGAIVRWAVVSLVAAVVAHNVLAPAATPAGHAQRADVVGADIAR